MSNVGISYRHISPENRKAFGVTEVEEGHLVNWVTNRMGRVLDAQGRGGSGTFIRLEDGQLALSTARHVVINCILSGELTVARLNAPGRSVEPKAIWIDTNKDAALLLLHEEKLTGDAIPYGDWPGWDNELVEGAPAIIAGVVGDWTAPSIVDRNIYQTKILYYWTGVSDLNNNDLIICDVDESNIELPDTFSGMSGGPCISLSRKLLGVNTAEKRRKPGTMKGEFLITRISALSNLFDRFSSFPSDADCEFKAKSIVFDATELNTGKRAEMTVLVGFNRSGSNLHEKYGHFGIIRGLVILNSSDTKRYRINCIHKFDVSGEGAEEDRAQTLRDELAFFLGDIDFRLVKWKD